MGAATPAGRAATAAATPAAVHSGGTGPARLPDLRAARRPRRILLRLRRAGRIRRRGTRRGLRLRTLPRRLDAPPRQRHGRRLRRPPDCALMASDLERQSRPVRVADVDGLPVADVHRGHPAVLDEHAVEAAVVDRRPAAVVEAQHHMGARHQRMCDADVGSQVATDDHVMARREGSLRSVCPNGQRGRRRSAHRQ